MPPYIYLGRFQKLKDVLLEALELSSRCTEPSASTIAATNSLSSWLIIELAHSSAATVRSKKRILHCQYNWWSSASTCTAYARVRRNLMDLSPDLKEISIIRVGAVADGCSFNCMINAGASIAAVETAHGRVSIYIGALAPCWAITWIAVERLDSKRRWWPSGTKWLTFSWRTNWTWHSRIGGEVRSLVLRLEK